MIQRDNKWYGWKRDIPDLRDFKYTRPLTIELPTIVDNRSTDWGIYDQDALGSCTANAALSAYRNVLLRTGHKDYEGSRLAQYYWTRFLENTVAMDAGAEIRTSIKVMAQFGVAPEKYCPYNIKKFTRKPTKKATTTALKHVAIKYESVPQRITDICAAVVQYGSVVFGFAVFESFESSQTSQTGVVTMPLPTESCLGGHAVQMIGYDSTKEIAIVKNSWGVDWGDGGYFYMPFDYLTNRDLAADFWSVTVAK